MTLATAEAYCPGGGLNKTPMEGYDQGTTDKWVPFHRADGGEDWLNLGDAHSFGHACYSHVDKFGAAGWSNTNENNAFRFKKILCIEPMYDPVEAKYWLSEYDKKEEMGKGVGVVVTARRRTMTTRPRGKH